VQNKEGFLRLIFGQPCHPQTQGLWVVDAKCSCARKLRDAKNMTTGAKNNCAK